ncbi:protein kinase family protein [Geminocystis sp. GBBB08]|uniref:protein kinase family protein n=1 Tax=Geminocystis sp. GBBB08 TaxID=2604140 RepID=UPI0027E2B366|nr:protein kinase family protein [Geminocystis sp. GBBB08]MBL1210387.1 protein kinase [Geminocystis sp. GBBB08]
MNNTQKLKSLENYKIINEISRHDEGIYINYLAENNLNSQTVILTNLIFPSSLTIGDINTDYQTILELLQSLNHQGIPHHLDYFKTEKGFCLIQEYPTAIKSLFSINQYTLEEIKKIAISTLNILVYLQTQSFPIFHHQIRPENLLIDSDFQVYLINFGFAQLGMINCPFYSIMNKSKGFIPPEEKRGRKLTKNSDVYSLGVTLSCLVTNTPSDKINSLIGQDGAFNLLGLISNQMSLTWIEWLENIVAINPQHRYPDATSALTIIDNIDINRLPDIKFTPNSLDLKSNDYGEIITQTIMISNLITDTNLEGKWEVAPSKYDVSVDNLHPWITFKPSQFKENKINCQITIDTNKLKAGKIYKRKLIIKANSSAQNHVLPLRIKTATIKSKNLIYSSLIVLFVIALIGGWLSGVMISFTPYLINWLTLIFGFLIGSIGGYGASFSKIDWFVKAVGSITSLIIIVGLMGLGTDVDLIMGFIVGFIVSCFAGMMIKFYREKNCPQITTIILALLTAILGITLGINFNFPNGNSLLLFLISTAGLPLLLILLNPYWQYQKRLNHYHQQQKYLIQS